MAELKLEHIKKTYDNNNTVVKDFNLHITDKRIHCICWTIGMW